ncbi:MAG: ABC transporter ATP-binding protein [Patescibacteria group bacterium]
MAALQVDGVSKIFHTRKQDSAHRVWQRPPRTEIRAVNGVSFTVPRGEIFGILGPNGSGKSTLVRLVSTLLLPDEGSIEVFGRDVVGDRLAVRGMINRVTVEASFFKKLSALENLSYAARLYDVPRRDWLPRALSILDRLGFSKKRAYCPLEELSRGMQQKVAIARALLTSPVLILLDEPTTGLDPRSKREVQDFILDVRREHDATVLLTTHDMMEAERLCQRIAVIDRGRFVAVDDAAGLRRLAGGVGGEAASLEDAFFALTGRQLEEEETGD